jgi:alkylated DNA repair dioxygenase AlkB
MEQQELIPAVAANEPEPRVPGFSLKRDYVTPDEEGDLIARVDEGAWENDYKRRIQQFGLGYSSGESRPKWLRDFPDWLKDLAERVAGDSNFERFPENCVINEYVPPQGIGPHRDYSAFGSVVACVSLGSEIVMDFKEPEKKLHIPLHVPARSLWVINGPARWQWTHGIAPRLTDWIRGERRSRSRRISITFRTAKHG